MEQRQFGATALRVSAIGFGAWGIGGPAMVGSMPIGWGKVDDSESIAALRESRAHGITFFDTADFYGLGHSEELIGSVFGNDPGITIATKVGHRIGQDQRVVLDYSKEYILSACEASLRRLRRETIDYYQLHSAKIAHLEKGGCIEAMEQLVKEGKIRAWGISLHTFRPEPEAEFFFSHKVGNGFQLVLNVINQRSISLIERAAKAGYGIIVRMPLQFGLLTGKFTAATTFPANDHRSFRLTPPILKEALASLDPFFELAKKKNMTPTALALSFCISLPGVSTVIPGIKTPGQTRGNTEGVRTLSVSEVSEIRGLYETRLKGIVGMMEKAD